jgi:hypothetical protein
VQKRRFQRTVSVEVFRKVRLAVCVLAVVALLHVRVDACATKMLVSIPLATLFCPEPVLKDIDQSCFTTKCQRGTTEVEHEL